MPFNPQERKEFEVITSSLGDPQSNGKVENAIKTAKAIMKNAKQAGADIYLSFLDWRNTPYEGVSSSPSERMLRRRTRTLPSPPVLLKPKIPEDAKDKLIQQKSKQVSRNTEEL